MREQKRQRTGGFFKLIIIIVIFFILGAYFDLDLGRILDSEFIHTNWTNLKQFVGQISGYLRIIVNYLTNLVK